MEEKVRWTMDKWKEFVDKNSKDSYSLAICLAILILYESGCYDEEECKKILFNELSGLSGYQADIAIYFYLNTEVEGLPNEAMARVRRKRLAGLGSNING